MKTKTEYESPNQQPTTFPQVTARKERPPFRKLDDPDKEIKRVAAAFAKFFNERNNSDEQ